ncbi:MAG: DUF3794 domain-containing protein [Ruminococcaceae bacterium]|nr:DUF3794 domain-containing protein [Oscillospiraceae bacterium]
MNVDFQRESIHVSEMRAPQTLTLLVEGDVIVPDVKPDIKEVLLTEANAVITGREHGDGKLLVTGASNVKILYMPEGAVQPKCIETRLDFKDSFELYEEGTTVAVSAHTEHVEFSLINSRKLHVKVVVSLTAKSYIGRDISYLKDAEEGTGLKVRKRFMSAYRALADTSREILISEGLEIPGAKPDIEEMIKLEVHARKDECKVMSGKILLKGAVAVHALYLGADEEAGVERMEYELPFSEMVDVDGLEDDCLCHVRYQVKDVYYSVKEDVNGDLRLIALDVVLTTEILAGKTEEFEVIDDCYSTEGAVEITRERVHLDELLGEGVSYENIKEIIPVTDAVLPVNVVYTLSCRPLVKELQIVGEQLTVKGKLVTFVLYGSGGGEQSMYSLVHESDFEHIIPVDGLTDTALCECNVSDSAVSFSINAAGEIELRTMLEFYMRALRRTEPELMTGCELREEEAEKLAGSLVIYFARAEDTLWDVAKRYRIDREKIKLLNQITEERLSAGQKILIPAR